MADMTRISADDAKEGLDNAASLDTSFPTTEDLLAYKTFGKGVTGRAESYEVLETLVPPGREGSMLWKSSSIPTDILEHLEGTKGESRRGIFPAISRAWVSVDAVIYIWNFEDGGDFCIIDPPSQPTVADPQQQWLYTITDATLLSKPNGREYTLVVATAVKIYMYAVVLDDGKLQIAPGGVHGMEVSTDDTLMLSLVGTPGGRVFMGGDDGHLYELQYQNSSRLFGIWGRSKCSKINHTNTMTRLWTSMSSFFGRDAECMQHLAYYEDAGSVGNGMLYALVSQESAGTFIKVFKVLESSVEEVCVTKNHAWVSDPIVSISAVPKSCKGNGVKSVALVAVTKKGTRYFYRHGNSMRDSSDTLVQFAQRPAFTNNLSNCFSLSAKGLMLMALPGENGDVLHVTRFNYIDHAKEKYSRDSKSKSPLEQVLKFPLNGNVVAMEAKYDETIYQSHNALANQQKPADKYIIMTDNGVFVYMNYRTKEELILHLEKENMFVISSFFGAQESVSEATRREAVAALLSIICGRSTSKVVRERALRALRENDIKPQFPKTPEVQHWGIATAVVESEVLSPKYEGMCQYLNRVLGQLWWLPLVRVATNHTYPTTERSGQKFIERNKECLRGNPKVELVSLWEAEEIQALEEELLLFMNTLEVLKSEDTKTKGSYAGRLMRFSQPRTIPAVRREIGQLADGIQVDMRGRSVIHKQYEHWMDRNQEPLQRELEQLRGLQVLLTSITEIIAMWGVLLRQPIFSDVMGDLDKEYRTQLVTMPFKDIASSAVDSVNQRDQGIRSGKNLLLHIVLSAMKRKNLSDVFGRKCPTLHDKIEQGLEEARKLLREAETQKTSTLKEKAQLAQKKFIAVYQECGKAQKFEYFTSTLDGALRDTCERFSSLYSPEGHGVYYGFKDALRIALESAKTLGSGIVSDRPESLEQARMSCYDCLTAIFDRSLSTMPNLASRDDARSIRQELIEEVMNKDDRRAQYIVFNRFILDNSHPSLLSLECVTRSAFVEDFLTGIIAKRIENTGVSTRTARNLLADLYTKREEHIKAARTLQELALLSPTTENVSQTGHDYLKEAVEYLSRAVGLARSSKNDVLSTDLEMLLSIADLQQRARDSLLTRLDLLKRSNRTEDGWGMTEQSYITRVSELNIKLCGVDGTNVWNDLLILLRECKLHAHLLEAKPFWKESLTELDFRNALMDIKIECENNIERIVDSMAKLIKTLRKHGTIFSSAALDIVISDLEFTLEKQGDSGQGIVKKMLEALKPGKNAKPGQTEFNELFESYCRVVENQETWHKKIHVLTSVSSLLELWVEDCKDSPSGDTSTLSMICEPIVSGWIEELNCKDKSMVQGCLNRLRKIMDDLIR
eukprot:m.53880 g.53880  ORF g.53880 m.53880 type:complete len:1360 (-) comp10885_c0_seq2:24-4103(-)